MNDVLLFILNAGWLGGGEWRLEIALGDTMLMWVPTYRDNPRCYLWQPMHWTLLTGVRINKISFLSFLSTHL
jgi:hypothetical protein